MADDKKDKKPEVDLKDASASEVLDVMKDLVVDFRDYRAEEEKRETQMEAVQARLVELELDTRRKSIFEVTGGRAVETKEDFHKVMGEPTKDERLQKLQVLNDDLLLTHAILMGHRDVTTPYAGVKSLNLWRDWNRATTDFGKAMDTATATEGAEWVPTGLSAELQRMIDLNLRVAGLHRTLPMPTNPYKLPILTGHATSYLAAEQLTDTPTNITASQPATKDVTFDAVKPAGRILWSGEVSEDSIVPMLPFLREEVGVAIARGIEKACIDGQPSGTIDTGDAPGATDVRSAWDGYRKYAETNSTVKYDMATDFDLEGFTTLRQKMGKTGVLPADLAWVPSVSVYFQMLNLKDANNNPVVVPVYAYGPQATAVTGELGALQGIPIVTSEFVREDLNADGIYDGVTETQTAVILVHRPSWAFGNRRELKVMASDIPYMEADVMVIVGHTRLDLQSLFPFATQVACSLGYNIAS